MAIAASIAPTVMSRLQPSSEDGTVTVVLPTLTRSSYNQQVIGKPSSVAGCEDFRGIPYGRVPGRWQHSVLLERLPDDTFDATRNGPQCPQPRMFANTDTFQSHLDWPTDVSESEFDCLNLWVVRPSPEALAKAGFDSEKEHLPVYVVIHGGGYGFGAGTDPIWDPTRLVSRGLSEGKPFIGVNINYRLGIFGFGVSTDIIIAQDDGQVKGGNFGLGDQHVALRWVARNIAAFGGDPDRVTIAGQSAGGVSVHAHAIEAKFGSNLRLFQRAVIQSGSMGTLGPTPLTELDRKWEAIFEKLDLGDGSKADLTHQLSQIPPADLLKTAVGLGWIAWPLVKDDLTVRDRANGRWSVHLDQIETSVASGDEKEDPVDVLIGDVEDEGIYGPQVSAIKSYERLQTLLEKASVSQSAIRDLFQAYNISKDTEISLLHQRINKLMTDYQFGNVVQKAREELSSTAEDQRRPDRSLAVQTTTRSYRIKFGNPFPGPNHNVAHHCVDLLYIYDCFHEHMVKADEEEASAGHSGDCATNEELTTEVQSQWIISSRMTKWVVEKIPQRCMRWTGEDIR